MKKCILVFLILFSLAFSEFILTEVEVKITGIGDDGSAKIKEKITFKIIGDSEKQLYEDAINRNELSFWSNITDIPDIRFHIDTSKVNVEELAITPQPINENRCNPLQRICHGEIQINYLAAPRTDAVNNSVKQTGVFSIDKYKPRTTKYTLNKDILVFTRTDKQQTIIDKNNVVIIELPEGSIIKKETDLMPVSSDVYEQKFPLKSSRIVWTNTPPTNPALVFETEDSLYTEVSLFFKELVQKIQRIMAGNEGPAIIIIFIILVSAYIYLNRSKTKSD